MRREQAWWLANRDHVDVFADHLIKPHDHRGASCRGRVVRAVSVPGVRRVYLRRIHAHIYYTFDDEQVIVRALWGARHFVATDNHHILGALASAHPHALLWVNIAAGRPA